MKRAVTYLIFITIISKIFGFVRDIVLSYFYGTTPISDAYLISQTIPAIIFGSVITGIITGFIPMYSKIKREESEEEALTFTNNLISIVLVISTIIVVIMFFLQNRLLKFLHQDLKERH